jgi:hypothetical protein
LEPLFGLPELSLENAVWGIQTVRLGLAVFSLSGGPWGGT